MDRRRLNARRDGERRSRVPQDFCEGSIYRYTDEHDNRRPQRVDLLLEDVPAFEVFRRTKIVDARTGPCHEVGDTEPPFREPHVIDERQRFGDQPRLVEQLPEPVGRAGEVMPGLG